MAKKVAPAEPKTPDENSIIAALAKAVATGDIVNFRQIFSAFSPARPSLTEDFDSEKYRYLLPDAALGESQTYRDADALVKSPEILDHVRNELKQSRPPQLPAALVLALADNAARHGHYTNAAQAYELLRIRRKMQELFLDGADQALDSGDLCRAVRGYRIGTGIGYDYAAFPEPLPVAPRFQTGALMLHGEYPRRPQDSIALQEDERHITIALQYLLNDSDVASRLQTRDLSTRLAFVTELVKQLDPDWEVFVQRYKETCDLTKQYSEQMKLKQDRATDDDAEETLEEEIVELSADDPRKMTAHLLGREIPDGAWWQYMKELAFEHPAAILFIARQIIGDHELLIPRYRSDSALATALGLVLEPAVGA